MMCSYIESLRSVNVKETSWIWSSETVSTSAGDEILELNGESLPGLTHDEALHKFKVMQLYCKWQLLLRFMKSITDLKREKNSVI